MRYKLFGKSGLRVSELALGTMTFGEDWGWGASKEVSQQMFDAYAEAGGNFIDTANRYTDGTSERFVGEFVAADREHFVVATKFTLKTRTGDPNAAGNHRKNMVQALEASLKRLNMDYVDVYWLHAWDFMTPVDEVMRGLDDLVRAGKVLYVGVSDTPAWVVSQANTLAELRGWSRFAGLQIRYSLADRAAERDLLPMARALDLAVTPWSVLGAGVLTGKYNDGVPADSRATLPGYEWMREIVESEEGQRRIAIVRRLTTVAKELGTTPTLLALAWCLKQPTVSTVILGASRVSQVHENLKALDVLPLLTGDVMATIDDVLGNKPQPPPVN